MSISQYENSELIFLVFVQIIEEINNFFSISLTFDTTETMSEFDALAALEEVDSNSNDNSSEGTKYLKLIDEEIVKLETKVITSVPADLTNRYFNALQNLFEHSEPRIRSKSAILLKLVCQASEDVSIWKVFGESVIIPGITRNYVREETVRPTVLGSQPLIAMDDTTGWNKLETYIVAYHMLITGLMGHPSTEIISSDFIYSLFCSTIELHERHQITSCSMGVFLVTLGAQHVNRHIRERTFNFILDFFILSHQPTTLSFDVWRNWEFVGLTEAHENAPRTDAESWYPALIDSLYLGMNDDWSQVRYAAALACAELLAIFDEIGMLSDEENDWVTLCWSRLIGTLCLNRFHAAKSLQTVSLAIWETYLLPDGLGRHLLLEYCDNVSTYYITSTRVRNHMICEAACYALTEFATKLIHPSDAINTYLFDCLLALKECLYDERWPVKDAASIASAKVFRTHYLTTTQASLLDELLRLYSQGLEDCIWSVRENAALAMVEILDGSRSIAESVVTDKVLTLGKEILAKSLLLPVQPVNNSSTTTQSSISNGFSFLPKGMLITNSTFPGTAPPPEDIFHTMMHPANHPPTNKASLTRKGWGCCIDCVELRQAKPWEVCSGAVYLLREMSSLNPDLLLEEFVSQQEGTVVVSPLHAISKLLEGVDYLQYEKLHALLYQTLPVWLSSLCALSAEGTAGAQGIHHGKILSAFLQSLIQCLER